MGAAMTYDDWDPQAFDDWLTTDPRDREPDERDEEPAEEPEEPPDHDPCPECARSLGPHYRGPCDH
jgi:hypothetical protein